MGKVHSIYPIAITTLAGSSAGTGPGGGMLDKPLPPTATPFSSTGVAWVNYLVIDNLIS
jgi:hypothetical protein